LPERQMSLPLIQLVGTNDGMETKQGTRDNLLPYNYDWLFTNTGLRMVASYAVAIALPTKEVVDGTGNVPLAGYIAEAHRHGLMVLASLPHNTPNFPSFAPDLPSLVDFYFSRAGVDGIYTDMFADVQRILRQKSEKKKVELPPQNEAPTLTKEELPEPQNDLPPFFKNLNLSRPTPPDSLQAVDQENVLPK
jgi:hypothetical protein